ncbi:MAG: DUF7715 family protein, partial [Acidimicrobiia bacterium]
MAVPAREGTASVYRLGAPGRRTTRERLRSLPAAPEAQPDPDGLKVLVATRRGQGLRDNDYYWLTDGEFVRLDPPCRRGRAVDVCGCGRGFAGCQSQQSGTTAAVALWPGSPEDYVDAIADALAEAGYIDSGDPLHLARPVAENLMELA